VDLDVLSLDGEGVGDVRSASRRKRSRPDGVPRRASWGDRGGHWEAIVLGELASGMLAESSCEREKGRIPGREMAKPLDHLVGRV